MSENATTERTLLEKFIEVSRQREKLKLELKAAQKEFAKAGIELIEMLNAHDKTETATYEGLGYGLLAKPRLQASCSQENKEKLFEFLREIDRADIIKTDVNAQSLTSFVREVMEDPETGVRLPDFINLVFLPNIQLRGENGKMISSFTNDPTKEE